MRYGATLFYTSSLERARRAQSIFERYHIRTAITANVDGIYLVRRVLDELTPAYLKFRESFYASIKHGARIP